MVIFPYPTGANKTRENGTFLCLNVRFFFVLLAAASKATHLNL
jgi:hypothetical protein